MTPEGIDQPLLRIYLDVCCLNRPFDGQRQDRIRLESEAVLLILGYCEAGTWQWISSAVDALHRAYAEQATVNIFLTTDDRVLRIAASHAEELHVRVANPLTWLVEVR